MSCGTPTYRSFVLSGLMSREFLQHQLEISLRSSLTAEMISQSWLEGKPRKSLVSSTGLPCGLLRQTSNCKVVKRVPSSQYFLLPKTYLNYYFSCCSFLFYQKQIRTQQRLRQQRNQLYSKRKKDLAHQRRLIKCASLSTHGTLLTVSELEPCSVMFITRSA